jgi:hypothetical protein
MLPIGCVPRCVRATIRGRKLQSLKKCQVALLISSLDIQNTSSAPSKNHSRTHAPKLRLAPYPTRDPPPLTRGQHHRKERPDRVVLPAANVTHNTRARTMFSMTATASAAVPAVQIRPNTASRARRAAAAVPSAKAPARKASLACKVRHTPASALPPRNGSIEPTRTPILYSNTFAFPPP